MAKKFIDNNGVLYLWQKIVNKFVQKEAGKGLSTNDYTTDEKNKLAGIQAEANKTVVENVLTSTSTENALSAAQGKELDKKISAINDNLENLGAGDMLKSVYDINGDGKVDTAENAEKLGGTAAASYALKTDIPDSLEDLTDNATHRTVTDEEKAAWNAKSNFSGSYNDLTDVPDNFVSAEHTHEMTEVTGLGDALNGKVDKVENKGLSTNDYTTEEKTKLSGIEANAQANVKSDWNATEGDAVILNKPTTLGGYGITDAIPSGEKGSANGVATLDGNGLIPSAQLPSYVDDIVEGYFKSENNLFYQEKEFTNAITGESGKIYVDLATSGSYRYGGSIFVPVTSSDMTALTNEEIENIIKTEIVE